MDEFCGSPFWLHNLTWNVPTQPDLSPCFQETILVWVPCFLIFLLVPLELISNSENDRKPLPSTLQNSFKTHLTTLLCALSVIELIDFFVRAQPVSLVDCVTPIIKSLAYILVFGLNVLHRNKGVHTSGTLFLFWCLMSLATIVNMRSLLRYRLLDHSTNTLAEWDLTTLKLTARFLSAPIVLIQLVLACFADKRAHNSYFPLGEEQSYSPEDTASILSLYTFWWLNPIMRLGYKRALIQKDLYAVRDRNKTEVVTRKFDALLWPAIRKALESRRANNLEQNLYGSMRTPAGCRLDPVAEAPWASFAEKRRDLKQRERVGDEKRDEAAKFVGLTCIVIKTFWPDLLIASILKLVVSLLTFASPILLGSIISFVSSDEPNWKGLLYGLSLFLLSIAETVFSAREEFITSTNVMRIQTCLISAVYRKAIKLSNQGRKDYTTGQIVNLMSTDSYRVVDLVQSFNDLWAAPLQLVLSMVLLYQQLGIAILAGLLITLINIPFNGWVAVKLRQLQRLVMRQKDKRIKLLSEIFNGIKIVKIHAWERPFIDRTKTIRDEEIRCLTAQTWYSAGITFAFTFLPFIVALASFATYVLMDQNNVLDANRVFVSLSLFNIIRVPLAFLPTLITNLSVFLVSVRRLNKFLESDEVDPSSIKQINDGENVLQIKNGVFKWEQDGDIVLDRIDLRIPRGKLVAVVGPVGSGKSSLVSALLGDLEKCEGEVSVDQTSSIAYVPQEAWILNTTLKENILFGKLEEEERYRRVLEVCALMPDIETLEWGDQSEIGEKGLNLSGGQKQRVSLARAVYADADIYLMDDPMNAVDAHVGRHIFDQIIGPRGILRDRTRLLVTNKLSILPEVDHIVVMKDGRVSESGSFEKLLKNRGVFSQLLVRYLLENVRDVNISEADARTDVITRELKRLEMKMAQETEIPTMDRKIAKGSVKRIESPNGSSHDKHQAPPEVSRIGSVGLTVHMNFIRTMGLNFMLALAIYVVSSVFALYSSVWLSNWSDDALNVTLSNDTALRDLRLGVYAGLGLGEAVLVMASTVLLNFACLRASRLLHNGILERVLRAPLSWFNSTPSGRIMNRFSSDVDTVDEAIRFNVRLLMMIALRSIISILLISVGSVYLLILLIPIVFLYFLLQTFYVATSRQLKRIESVTRSPIYSHFSETISGTSSIRAFGVSEEFILEANRRIDANHASRYIGIVSSRWLSMRLEFLGFIVVLTASLVAVLSRDTITPGIAGLSVSYSLGLTIVLNFLVKIYSDYETNVVSVERLLEYAKVPIESEDGDEPTDPNWPAKGEIVFDNFSARYRPDLDLVLRNFSLYVSPSEKVGLVGRTGAGKSSITLALFRILEAHTGSVTIDGMDISFINLNTLRSKLSIIPQEPILFTGTIRQNVDPTESHTDNEIWRAIELAHLGAFLRDLPLGLDQEVSEGGSNFSVGQKQLFCLARTLLRRSKILILDEATAAVDVETDDLIQQTIRKEFKDSTIVTIAHRLETIQDYDRVVVMEAGSLIEQGPPSTLVRQPGTKFHDLAKEAGLIK